MWSNLVNKVAPPAAPAEAATTAEPVNEGWGDEDDFGTGDEIIDQDNLDDVDVDGNGEPSLLENVPLQESQPMVAPSTDADADGAATHVVRDDPHIIAAPDAATTTTASPDTQSGGLFMGRLTNFIDKVTQPDEAGGGSNIVGSPDVVGFGGGGLGSDYSDVDAGGDGWDDEGDDDFGFGSDDAMNQQTQQQPFEDGFVAHQEQHQQQGWDGDNDMDLNDIDNTVAEQQGQIPPTQHPAPDSAKKQERPSSILGGWIGALAKSVTLPDEDPSMYDDLKRQLEQEQRQQQVQEQHQQINQQTQYTPSPGGCEEENDDLDDLNLDPDAKVHIHNTGAHASTTIPAKEVDEEGDWADDDLDDQDFAVEEKETLERTEAIVVDHVPPPGNIVRSVNVSLASVAQSEDFTRDTGPDNDDAVYGDEDEMEYGPIVDRTPKKRGSSSSVPFQRHDSLVVQRIGLQQDIKDDDEMDESEMNDQNNSDLDLDDEDLAVKAKHEAVPEVGCQVADSSEPGVVDHVPPTGDRPCNLGASDPSIRVLASVGDTVDVVDDDEQSTGDGAHKYGPVVDQLPQTPAILSGVMSVANSLAVGASVLGDDFEDDDGSEAEDGGSGGWNDGDGLDNLSTEKEVTEKSEPGVVDHVPSEGDETSDFGTRDPSVRVLASVGDIVDVGDDDEKDINDEVHKYGPVVDQLPQTPAMLSGTVSVANSLAVGASILGDDFDYDDGIGAEGDRSGGWDGGDDGIDDQDLVSAEEEVPQRSEPDVVDCLPSAEDQLSDHGSSDPSVRVLASVGDTIDVADYDEKNMDDEAHKYGPVVDQLPQTPAIASATISVANSLAVGASVLDLEDGNSVESSAEDGDNAGWNGDGDLTTENDQIPKESEPGVVDHVPSLGDESDPGTSDPSVRVLASLGDVVDVADGDDENAMNDEAHKYGPVVDLLPQTPAIVSGGISVSNSLAVNATTLESEFGDDDEMDDTCFDRGTVEENCGGWEEDDLALDAEDGNDNGVATDPLSLPQLSKLSETEADELLASKQPKTPKTIVDHTPSEALNHTSQSTSRSIEVLATIEDLSSKGTDGDAEDNIFENENEEKYGPVVDHTPRTPKVLNMISSTTSLAVQLDTLEEDFREDDAMDETCFGDSTIAGGTLDGTGEDEWDHDDAVLDGEETDREVLVKQRTKPLQNTYKREASETMVDHTPSEIGSPAPRNGDPSVDALRSDVNSDFDCAEGDVYGPVVDHTPATPAPPAMTRSDSVVVQVYDLDTVDETIQGGSTVDDGDATATEGDITAPDRSAEDQLVDRIPRPRPESRFGDASTLVAAEPSEVLSEVDDMEQELGNFGPVVDVTPAAPLEPPPGAGSTAVFAPASVAADDLDADADETEAAPDENGWDDGHLEVNEAPNPQSGNDEPATNRANEQLVDFLPPQEEGQVDATREESSEIAVGGAQSLMQPEDPKEDDFGPVVDQIPTLQSSTPSILPSALSNGSMATQVNGSECSATEKEDCVDGASDDLKQAKPKVVVDNLPHMRNKHHPVDSIATLGQSQLTEEEEEDDTKFGPVVDQLPNSRASLAPSRGGSTVDALATVSEVDSDEGDGDGWDDEIDFDASEGCVSDKPVSGTRMAFRRSPTMSSDNDRSMTVRFDSSVTQSQSPEETRFLGTESGATDGWANDMSFFEAETPPSTPYRKNHRPVQKRDDTTTAVVSEESKISDEGKGNCQTCTGSKTIECPFVERLLQINSEDRPLWGNVVTPEGETVKINFSKLLQDEITKRRLVEEEAKALRSAVESRKLQDSLVAMKESELEAEIVSLRKMNDDISQQVEGLQSERADLRQENMILSEDIASSRRSLLTYEEEKDSYSERQAELESEIRLLKTSLDDSAAVAASAKQSQNQIVMMETEIALKTRNCRELDEQMSEIGKRLKSSEEDKLNLTKELGRLSQKLEEDAINFNAELSESQRLLEESQMSLEKSKGDMQRIVEEHELKIRNLLNEKDLVANQVTDLQIQHAADTQQQQNLLQSKLQNIQALEMSLMSMENEKNTLGSDLSRWTKESESLSKDLQISIEERDALQQQLVESKESIDSLQKLINEHGMEKNALESRRELEIASLKEELKTVEDSLASSEIESRNYSSNIKSISNEKDSLIAKLEDSHKARRSLEIAVEQAKLLHNEEVDKNSKNTETINSLRLELSRLSKAEQKAEADRRQFALDLEQKLNIAGEESKVHADKVRELESLLSGNRDELDSALVERDALIEERKQLLEKCKQGDQRSATSIAAIQKASQEQDELRSREVDELIAKVDSLEAAVAHAKILRTEEEAKTAKCREEISCLQSELSRVSEIEQKPQDRSKEVAELNANINRLQMELGECEKRLHEQVSLLSASRKKSESLTTKGDTLVLENKQLREKCDAIELSLSKTEEQLHDQARLHAATTLESNVNSAGLQEKLEESQKLSQAQISRYEKQVVELKKSVTTLEQQLQDRANAVSNLEEECIQLRNVAEERDALAEENEDMLVQFGVLKGEMDASDEYAKKLQDEVQALRRSAETGNQEGELYFASDSDDLQYENESLRKKIEELLDEKSQLEINLGSKLQDTSLSPKEESSASSELQSKCDELQYKYQNQVDEISRLNDRLADEAIGLQTLRDKLDQMEREANNKSNLVYELQEGNADLKSQLEKAENSRRNTESNLGNISGTMARCDDERIKQLEAKLKCERELVAKLQASVESLEIQLESTAKGSSTSPDSEVTKEGKGDKELEIAALKGEVESLGQELAASQSKLSSKQEFIDRVTQDLQAVESQKNIAETKVEEIFSQQQQENIIPDVTGEYEDTESLRSYVVALAVALERSENRRAEAIHLLVNERQTNADSIRRLSESVKRYYSTVSFGDLR